MCTAALRCLLVATQPRAAGPQMAEPTHQDKLDRALARFAAGPFESWSVTPQQLQIVVRSVCSGENVKHHVDEVDEDPAGAVPAAEAIRSLADLLAVLDRPLRHGAHLTIRGTRADYRKIGHRTDSAEIERHDIFRLIVVGDPGKLDGKLEGLRGSHIFSIAESGRFATAVLIRGAIADRAELATENLAFRQQLAVLEQQSNRLRLRKRDRMFRT